MNLSSPYFDLACVVVSAMALLGFGLLFVRASKIERRNLVGGVTLALSVLAMVLLWNSAEQGQRGNAGIAWSAIFLSLFGFGAGWLLDRLLGPRRGVHRDNATLGGDLAD